MGKKTDKKTKPAKRETKTPSDEAVLGVLETLRTNNTEATSPVIRDKLGLDKETGRDTVGRILRKLEKDGKVVISEKPNGKKKQYVFSLKA